MPQTTTVRFTDDDLRLLEAIQEKTGIVSRSEVLRLAIRALAAQEGVPAVQRRGKRGR
jgi:metal-responsive CopG/Arc/MetJ family transcriptional regulator